MKEHCRAGTETQSVTFTGSGSEYFGVWLVNFTLSVPTLGLYPSTHPATAERLERLRQP